MNAATFDRACGAVLGAAAGDALGAGYEFGSAALEGRPRMIGGGLGGFEPGEWTDDTAQSVAILRIAATGADLRTAAALDQVADGFAEWFAGNPPDVGIQTRAILGSLDRHPTGVKMADAASAYLARVGRAAGNGSLMRTSSVALAHLGDPAAIVEAAFAISELTHAERRAGEACALWSLAIGHAVQHAELPDPRDLLVHLPDDCRTFWRERLDEAERRDPSALRPNGYVVVALQAAWSAITHTPADGCDELVRGIEAAIAIGDDTDTVAAIAGALLGARWGASAVPAEWREVLHGWPGITASELCDLATLAARGGEPDRDGWPGCDRIDYSGQHGYDALAKHPYDDGVYLAGAAALDDLPTDVTAVVSLCRLGAHQVPSGVKHIDFRLIDTSADDNPNLAYVIDDAARTVARFRDAGETVLLHCVAAQSRTPTVAARYALLRGHDVEVALRDVCAALPAANPNPALVDGLRSCDDKRSEV